ncbi:LLM class flavin-dependent oxidoreductase [Actinoplanes sp. OR16]|uniref:LLM class flavin-dependent oxidoreductase n=1 Tax=Actinoplanes sp. OR16 TaxID=946334 RepID=UPI000FD6D9DC|nr:LLM class flavin-dependent oxidoreductase [Actinoplanes sp. OR16]
MRISIWPGAGQPYGDVLEAARHASETGWHGVWIADHFMPNDGTGADPLHPVLEAGSLVAAIGAVVPRVRIGTLVYGNTYRHPAVLANMAATVDHVTRGRFTLGVGAGWQINEHEQYGIELSTIGKRIDRFVEALLVIKGLLRTPRTTVDGSYYQLKDAVCEPKPLQDPLPIMIGAKGEQRMLRVVAEHADMWNTWGRPDLIKHKSSVLDQHCADAGRNPADIVRTAQALTVVDGDIPPDLSMPVIGGSRKQLQKDLAAYQEAGVDELIIPDGLLGTGAAKFRAMDTLRALVHADS